MCPGLENSKEEWLALKPFIGRILIRLGPGTSARMVLVLFINSNPMKNAAKTNEKSPAVRTSKALKVVEGL